MLYTALTRQMDRVVILHQGDLAHLRALRSPVFSEVARRVTNLFAPPTMIDAGPPAGAPAGTVGRTFLEDKLIHRSARGDLVSSKSELVIADLLFEAEKKLGIRYFFERVLIGENGAALAGFLDRGSQRRDLVLGALRHARPTRLRTSVEG
jgi:hypothetical protein